MELAVFVETERKKDLVISQECLQYINITSYNSQTVFDKAENLLSPLIVCQSLCLALSLSYFVFVWHIGVSPMFISNHPVIPICVLDVLFGLTIEFLQRSWASKSLRVSQKWLYCKAVTLP